MRAYPPMVVAEVTETGGRRTAIGDGFRAIAGYIFGDNSSRGKVPMTAPVLQQRATAATGGHDGPDDDGTWVVRFVMPGSFSLSTLPKPNDTRLTLAARPASTFAVVRFSGWASDATIAKRTRALMSFMAGERLHEAGPPILAFFNPPWTLPFLRRNEIMIAVDGTRG